MIEQNLDVIKIGGTFLFDSQGGLKPAKLAPILEVIKKMKYLPVLIIGCGENMHQKTVEANLTDKPRMTSDGLEVSMDGRVEGFVSLYNCSRKPRF